MFQSELNNRGFCKVCTNRYKAKVILYADDLAYDVRLENKCAACGHIPCDEIAECAKFDNVDNCSRSEI